MLFYLSLGALLELGVSERSERELARVAHLGAVALLGVQLAIMCVPCVCAVCFFCDSLAGTRPTPLHRVCRDCLTLCIVHCDRINESTLKTARRATTGRRRERETMKNGSEKRSFFEKGTFLSETLNRFLRTKNE